MRDYPAWCSDADQSARPAPSPKASVASTITLPANAIATTQRAPKVRIGKRGKGMDLATFVAVGRMVLAAKAREEREARGKGKRPASIGTYVRKDSGACKLVPRK